MAFVGRVLLRNIRHVQKTRVFCTALCQQRLPAIAASQVHTAATDALSGNEGKQNGKTMISAYLPSKRCYKNIAFDNHKHLYY